MVVVVNSNDIMPVTTLRPYEEAVKYFNNFIKEVNNESWMVKLVEKNQVGDRLWATTVKNHKGCGGNYLSCIWIDPAYDF